MAAKATTFHWECGQDNQQELVRRAGQRSTQSLQGMHGNCLDWDFCTTVTQSQSKLQQKVPHQANSGILRNQPQG